MKDLIKISKLVKGLKQIEENCGDVHITFISHNDDEDQIIVEFLDGNSGVDRREYINII